MESTHSRITVDGIGNPLSYYNGSSCTFSWQNGRQLATAVKGSQSLSFAYNDEGIRTRKRSCVEITESSEEAAKGTVLIYIFEESPGLYKTIDVEFKNTPAGWGISGGNLQLLLSSDAELAEYS